MVNLKNRSVSTVGALLLVSLSVANLLGWGLSAEVWPTLFPVSGVVALNTLFCFALAGLALLLPEDRQRLRRQGQVLIGGLIILLVGLVLVQYLFHITPASGSWRMFMNVAIMPGDTPQPVNMASSTALAFVLVGLVLVLMNVRQRSSRERIIAILLQVFTFAIFALALFAAYLYLLRSLAMGWNYPTGRMAWPTSIGLMLLSFGLWSSFRQAGWLRALYSEREDRKILVTGAALLVVTALAAGLAGFYLLVQQSNTVLKSALQYSLEAHAQLFTRSVDSAVHLVREIASRTSLVERMTELSTQAGQPGSDPALQEIASHILASGTNGVRLLDRSGRLAASAGPWLEAPRSALRVNAPVSARLFWKGQWMLETYSPIQHRGQRVGILAAQLSLPDLPLPGDKKALGRIGELVVCAPIGQQDMLCLRMHPVPHSLRVPRQVNGHLLPMGHALAGRQGITEAGDYRRTEVVAAYMPLKALGLGMVLKRDAVEWHQPVFRQLGEVMPLLLLLILGSVMLLTWRVRPLAHGLVESRTRYRTVMENAADAIITIDDKGSIESFNPAAERLFAYSATEVVGQRIQVLMPDAYRDQHMDCIRKYLEGAEARIIGHGSRELLGRRCDGSVFPLELSVSEMWLGGQRKFIGMLRDISQRKQTEILLANEKQIMELIASGAPLPLLLRMIVRLIEDQFPNLACAILLLDERGTHLHDAVAIRLPAEYVREIGEVPVGPESGACGAAAHHKRIIICADIAQDSRWESWRELALRHGLHACWSVPILSTGGKLLGTFAAYYRESRSPEAAEMDIVNRASHLAAIILERRKAEENLAYLTHHDKLTDLPNRALLQDRLSQAIAFAQRAEQLAAVFFLDLDHFKRINDSLGHGTGDLLLQHVAKRLAGLTRDEDTVARLGGDEFVILLPDLAQMTDATAAAQRVLDALSQPFLLEGRELFIAASIGIALYPNDGGDLESLLRNADAAMYQAKADGRNCARFFAPEMNARAMQRLELENRLRRALDRAEFCLHYQPKIDLRTGQITGMEALIRWQCPSKGLVSPADFIPIAEESGLILPIGAWALREACRQNKAWQDAGLPALRVAVNLSGRQLMQDRLADDIAVVLQETGLEPDFLELEITESMLMQDLEQAIATLHAIRELGVSLAIDDFGTGFSSLNYLKRFPVDSLKIDRSFVRDVTSDPDDAAISSAIIVMAHSLDMRVIAEGVETEGQLAFLREHDCDAMQGYLFSRPVAADDFADLLKTRKRLADAPERRAAPTRNLLLVDDEPNILTSLVRLLRRDGYQILTANSAKAGFELLATQEVGVILSDQRMPEMNGVEFLRRVKELYPDTVRMVLSGYTELQSVTNAINEGAIYKFLTKPWDDDLLRDNVREAFQHFELVRENERLDREIKLAYEKLARANHLLEQRVEEKTRAIIRNLRILEVSQEILEHLPVAVIGIGEEGDIATANQRAQILFSSQVGLLLGCAAREVLPADLLTCLDHPGAREGEGKTVSLPDGRLLDTWCYPMGHSSKSKGIILVIAPKDGYVL